MVVISIKTIVIGRTPGVPPHLLSGIATGVPLPVETRDQQETMAQAMVSVTLGCLCITLSKKIEPTFSSFILNECSSESLKIFFA